MARPTHSRPRSSPPPANGHGEVEVSAVISTYLLTHLHHVLQRAEYGAQREGQARLAANYAELRQVLCLDARSLEPPHGAAAGPEGIDLARAA